MGIRVNEGLSGVGGYRMEAGLGPRLRALRQERGLSQGELAGDLVSASDLELIESGRLSPELLAALDGLAWPGLVPPSISRPARATR